MGNEIFFSLTWQCCVEWSKVDYAGITAAIHQWHRRLSACVQRLAVDILNIIFSHPLSIYRLVD